MMAQLINRKQIKREIAQILKTAQINPVLMTLLYLVVSNVLSLIRTLSCGDAVSLLDLSLPTIFIYILTALLTVLLSAGFVMYCMAVRRGEEADALVLFDGFALAGKIIALQIMIYAYTFLWSLLLLIPGLIASYRYRFAAYNLYENPELSATQALNMSKRQTMGYKSQLFMLDMSYLPWILLASLPLFVDYAALYGMISVPAFPDWAWLAVEIVWDIAVSLFYLASYHCADYAYYEIACSTSGVSPDPAGTPPWQDSEPNDFDGLNSF